jgi:hypothetical protein
MESVLAPVPVMQRYEWKYVLDAEQTDFFCKRLEGHMEPDAYGLTTISSLYYDTPDRRLIRTSIEKPEFKEKIRLRAYGRATNETPVYLELKRKAFGVVYKRRVQSTIPQVERFFEHDVDICTGGQINREGYKSVARQLAEKFGFEKVAITLRESHSASDNGWSAMLYDVASDEYCFSKKYELRIIDRVGGGDSFGGGLIYALLSGKSTQAAVEFAVAASALKHTIEGDYNMMSVAEVEKLAGGDGSGRIQR